MKDFNHIHNVLVDSGYPESHASEWYIKIEDYQGCQIIPHWYDCQTLERTKIAVKSLLNKTGIYSVTVYSPKRNPVSFHGYQPYFFVLFHEALDGSENGFLFCPCPHITRPQKAARKPLRTF